MHRDLILPIVLVWLLPFIGCSAISDQPTEMPVALDLEQKVKMVWGGIFPHSLFDTLASYLGIEAQVIGEVRGSGSFSGEMTWREAMDLICSNAGCDWQITIADPPVLEVTFPPLGSVFLEGMDQPSATETTEVSAGLAMEILAEMIQANLEMEELTGTVTLSNPEIPWREAMTDACRQVGCEWELEEGEPAVLCVRVRPEAP